MESSEYLVLGFLVLIFFAALIAIWVEHTEWAQIVLTEVLFFRFFSLFFSHFLSLLCDLLIFFRVVQFFYLVVLLVDYFSYLIILSIGTFLICHQISSLRFLTKFSFLWLFSVRVLRCKRFSFIFFHWLQKNFFANIGSIVIYAVLGTLITGIGIGVVLWYFGSQGWVSGSKDFIECMILWLLWLCFKS